MTYPEFYSKVQFVPRSKHTRSGFQAPVS